MGAPNYAAQVLGELHNENFIWKDGRFPPNLPTFDRQESGWRIASLGEDSTPLECFELFFSANIMNLIVEQTNLFYEQNHNQERVGSRKQKWRNVIMEEMYLFIAISFLMAQVKKLNIKDYWTNDVTLATPFFGKIFSRDRYLAILSAINFLDNTLENDDKLKKIKPLLTHLRNVYKEIFYPKIYVSTKA